MPVETPFLFSNQPQQNHSSFRKNKDTDLKFCENGPR